MRTNLVCDSYNSSYFLIDKKFQLASFSVHPLDKLSVFVSGNLALGQQIEELLTQRYRENFISRIENCFAGQCFSLEKKIALGEEGDVVFQVTFTPIFIQNEVQYVSCTVVSSNRIKRQLKLLNEYSHVASHELRAPISNILSLSSSIKNKKMEAYDVLRLSGLLSDINIQAEKLDEIIKLLNDLLHNNEHIVFFQPESVNPDSKHIVLLDDDKLTNRMHEMLLSGLDVEKCLVTFDEPKKAFDYVKAQNPDLLFLDLHMPEIDGWAFLGMMQEQGILVDVIIVSSSIDPLERSRARAFSVVKDFVTKPLTSEKLKRLFEKG